MPPGGGPGFSFGEAEAGPGTLSPTLSRGERGQTKTPPRGG